VHATALEMKFDDQNRVPKETDDIVTGDPGESSASYRANMRSTNSLNCRHAHLRDLTVAHPRAWRCGKASMRVEWIARPWYQKQSFIDFKLEHAGFQSI
jgi:hypothetical protein